MEEIRSNENSIEIQVSQQEQVTNDTSNQSILDVTSTQEIFTSSLPFPIQKRHKKRRKSKRTAIPANGKQNIRLTVTVERADLLIALADEMEMTTLTLIRSYVDRGIQEDINRLKSQITPKITEDGIKFDDLVRKDDKSNSEL